MKLWRLQKSFSPVLIALPNSGSFLPPEIASHMTDAAKSFSSNARHLIQLCEGPELRDAGVIASNVSPLVIDLSQPLPPSLDRSFLSLCDPKWAADLCRSQLQHERRRPSIAA